MHIRTPLRAACSSFQAATTPGNRHIHLYIYLDYIDICTHTKYTHTHIFSHSAVCKYMDVRTSLRAACSSFQAAITSGSRHIHLYIYLDYIHICTHIKYTHTHTCSHSAVCKYMDVRTSLRAACSSFQAAITSGSRHIHPFIYLDYIDTCIHTQYTHTTYIYISAVYK